MWRLGFDLGDARGSSYYTGMSFNVLAEGPGEPIAGGGRYDQLLARYGVSRPATGFAFDLENLQWALHSAGRSGETRKPFRIALGPGNAAGLRSLAARLRTHGLVVATLPIYEDVNACLAFAKAWGYDALLVVHADRAELLRARDSVTRTIAADDEAGIAALQAWAQEREKD